MMKEALIRGIGWYRRCVSPLLRSHCIYWGSAIRGIIGVMKHNRFVLGLSSIGFIVLVFLFDQKAQNDERLFLFRDLAR